MRMSPTPPPTAIPMMAVVFSVEELSPSLVSSGSSAAADGGLALLGGVALGGLSHGSNNVLLVGGGSLGIDEGACDLHSSFVATGDVVGANVDESLTMVAKGGSEGGKVIVGVKEGLSLGDNDGETLGRSVDVGDALGRRVDVGNALGRMKAGSKVGSLE